MLQVVPFVQVPVLTTVLTVVAGVKVAPAEVPEFTQLAVASGESQISSLKDDTVWPEVPKVNLIA